MALFTPLPTEPPFPYTPSSSSSSLPNPEPRAKNDEYDPYGNSPYTPNESSNFVKNKVQEFEDRVNSNKAHDPYVQEIVVGVNAPTRKNPEYGHETPSSHVSPSVHQPTNDRNLPSDYYHGNHEHEIYQQQSYDAHHEDYSRQYSNEVNFNEVHQYQDFSRTSQPTRTHVAPFPPPPPPMHKPNKVSHHPKSSHHNEMGKQTNVHHSSFASLAHDGYESNGSSGFLKERVQEANGLPIMPNQPNRPILNYAQEPANSYYDSNQHQYYNNEVDTPHAPMTSSNDRYESQTHLPTKSIDEYPSYSVKERVHHINANQDKYEMPALKAVVKQERLPEYRDPEPEKLSVKQKIALFENKTY